MRITTYALEPSTHFITEKRTDMSRKFFTGRASKAASITTQPYIRYGEGSITGEKCVGGQDTPYKARLVLGLGRCGA